MRISCDAGIGDFNGNGHDNLLWQRQAGTVALWLLVGFTSTSTGIIGNPGSERADIA